MPLLHEQVEGRPLWKLVCDACHTESDYLETLEAASEEENWHVSDDPDWEEVELEGHTILCDICHTLGVEDRGPILHYDVRDAIIDHLRRLPGGQELDFHPGTALWTVVNALAMGGPQEDLEARLLDLRLGDPRPIETAHAALQRLSTTTTRITTPGFVSAVPPPPSTATTVFINKESCELPDWVYTGAWVKRLADGSQGRVELIAELVVVLALNDEAIQWRRAKDAAFEEEFEPLPLPRTRYERLRADDVGLSLAVGW